ncbi:MAG: cytochrome d ubiquinol oxidase subunit II [Candidatus Zixiibacteriota bacterium]|nr:MAG: cytochrome d ubiquinol oxidase subunit II [candidate division Zixibacteria bacterium]
MSFSFDLNNIWYILIGVLFTGYAILDGFDLGAGALHLLVRGDTNRRIILNAIGPVWDGNEVWLVTGGGALFAAFPEAYATSFSGLYLAMVLLLVGLIFRAVAIDFRSKRAAAWWRNLWDTSFCVSSIFSALLVGVALGNIARGIPLTAEHEFAGSFIGLLNPYALLIGLTTVMLFIMHGSIYLVMKTEGELHDTIRRWINPAIIYFVITYIITTITTLLNVPHMVRNLTAVPLLWILPVLNVLAIANIPREIHRGRDFRAFLSSCASMAALLALFGIGMWPYMIYSKPFAENSLHIYNAASSPDTLKIMLIIALLGMPLVISYTVSIYYIFRGKVKLDASSY